MMMVIGMDAEPTKLTARQTRATECVNMRAGGYCASAPEGLGERRICPILRPRERNADCCPYRGIYGYHKQEGGAE